MTDKITKKTIDALRADARALAKTRYLFDSEFTGFGALATKTGNCSYFVEYRLGGIGGSPRRVTLGKHGILTPEEGRQRAKEELGKVARGADIAQEKKEARAKLKAGTFRDLSERYFAINGKREKTDDWKSRRWKEVHAMLEKSIYPILGDKPPETITRYDIAGLINETKLRSHSVARRFTKPCVLSSRGLPNVARFRTILCWAFVVRSRSKLATVCSLTPRSKPYGKLPMSKAGHSRTYSRSYSLPVNAAMK